MHVVPSIDHSLHFSTPTISWRNYIAESNLFRFSTKHVTVTKSGSFSTYQLSRRFLLTASPSMPSWIRPTGALSEFSCRRRCKLCLLPAYWPTIPWCTSARAEWLHAANCLKVDIEVTLCWCGAGSWNYLARCNLCTYSVVQTSGLLLRGIF
jgi:hypothetical protein